MKDQKPRKLDIAIISDVHLGTYGCNAKELLCYLKTIRPKMLILNGDLLISGIQQTLLAQKPYESD